MKKFSKFLFLIMLVVAVMYGGEMSAQINVNKLKDKAKNKIKKKDKDKDKNKDNTENNNSNDNSQEDAVVEDNTNNKKLDKLTFDASTIFVEYQSLFKEMELNPQTGEFKIKNINIKNLPKASYGLHDNEHKLTAVLKTNSKVVYEYSYGGISEYTVSEWTKGNCSSSTIITQPGKYCLEFQIDGKKADEINFSIIQSLNKNNKSGWFINDPLETLGMVSAKTIQYGKPVASSQFVFKFYEAILDIEGNFVDATPIDVSLIRVGADGKETYLGGYLDEELSHNHKWKLTDNIFFSKPDDRYHYVAYSDVLASEGKYYVGLFYNGDFYKYNFEVKGGEFVSTLSDRSTAGICWIEREYVGVPKYENFKPTANISGKADNIRMSLKKGSTTQGYAANKSFIFADGDFISKSLYLSSEIQEKYKYRLTESVVTLKKGNEILAQEITLSYNAGDFKRLMRDPETATFAVNKETDSYLFMEALAKLPAGTHKLKLVYELASGKNSDIVGIRTITFKSNGKNPTLTKWAEDTKKYLAMTNAELGEVAFLRAPTDEWVYFVNNCGTTVWFRVDEYKEYHLFPGDKAKFNRTGFMEQWNFGTWKWNDVPEFDVYKTVFILDANEISMLYLKQVPPEAIEKLKEIQDVEFKSQDAYVKKVKELIGEETFKKHENLLILSASIDYVRICK